ncbi:hypothetical protein AQUCO_01800045v1 [Aquilegia coerulea]|uniref:B box-type domain-containing protein n=1 Tax=Aquilegia coerulea TaxID=218851 RepID=A0A2G5DJM2_AQUCA|nr:hypothetical protein AQUCO_01800045v1 [Aquilegia coerulea]
MKGRLCELCNGEAWLYCVSDSAFLCLNCDARVHQANFLVARHVRRTICCKCKYFDGNSISGVGFRRHIEPICQSCLSNCSSDSNSSCTSSSTTCIISSVNQSSNQLNSSSKIVFSGGNPFLPTKYSDEVSKNNKKKKKKNRKIVETRSLNVDFKEEDILVNWYRKLGVKCNSNISITLALHAISICLQKFTNLPFRVSLASSLWLSLKLAKEKPAVATCQNLKKLEQISGVPAKLIILAEKKISIVLKKNEGKSSSKLDDDDLQEGWAECSD